MLENLTNLEKENITEVITFETISEVTNGKEEGEKDE